MDEFPGAQSQWRLHGDTHNVEFRATVDNFEKWHGSGNLLWASGHGVQAKEVSANGTNVELAFLLCDDRVVGPSQLLRDADDFSGIDLFMASACLLGKIPEAAESGSMVRAFNATLALRGCRRVTNALWELDDQAALVFSEKYMRAILKHCFDCPDANQSDCTFATHLRAGCNLGARLATLAVDPFATNCIVRKKPRVAAVARGPLSQQTNSLLRAKPN